MALQLPGLLPVSFNYAPFRLQALQNCRRKQKVHIQPGHKTAAEKRRTDIKTRQGQIAQT